MLIIREGLDTFGVVSDDGQADEEESEWVKLRVYIKVANLDSLKEELKDASPQTKAEFYNLLNLLEQALE